MKCLPNAGIMLGQRHRRWLNNKPALGKHCVFAGLSITQSFHGDGKSWKTMGNEKIKFRPGKVMENKNLAKSHGKVMEFCDLGRCGGGGCTVLNVLFLFGYEVMEFYPDDIARL